MKTLSTALFALPLVLALGTAARADDKPLETPYYPLKVGNTWTYTVGVNKVTVKVAKFEDVDKQLCARVESTTGGANPPLVELIAVKADGVYRFRAAEQTVEPPVRFLALPPMKDDSWKIDSKVGTEKLKGTFKSGELDELKVGATTYKNVVTVTGDDLDANGQKMSVIYYFAKEVGMIKQTVKIGGAEVVLELDKFEAGK
jgi:hypothetical protein